MTFAIMTVDNHKVVYPFFFSPFRAVDLRKADAWIPALICFFKKKSKKFKKRG